MQNSVWSFRPAMQPDPGTDSLGPEIRQCHRTSDVDAGKGHPSSTGYKPSPEDLGMNP